MQKYQDTVLLSNGAPLVGASVTVLTFPGEATASIFSDNGVTPTGNPLTTDSNGRFSFYAADGRYSLRITGLGIVALNLTDFLLEDLLDADPFTIGALTVTGVAKFAAGTVGLPAIHFGDSTTGFYRPALNQIGVTVAGAQVGLWSSTGLNNTALGATTPSTVAATTGLFTGTLTTKAAHGLGTGPRIILQNTTPGTIFSGAVRWLDGNGNAGWEVANNVIVGTGFLEFNEGTLVRASFAPGGAFTVNVSLTIGGPLTITAAASKIIPGATSISLRNNADAADNLLITDAGAVTFRSTVGGITTLTATTLAGTLSTAAQTSVTSLGTLTGLTVSGTAAFTNTSPFSVANGQTLTASVTAQTVGGATLTIPNFASVSDTFAFTTLAQTLSAKTLSGPTLSGTVSGTPTWGSNQAITLSTAAQGNVTSLGTLTSLTTSGTITITASASKIVPGATSFSHRNNADSADNLLITDAGAITGRTTITATTGMAVGAATAGTGGVAFPATAVAVADVNTLDDYEEGTWTPSVGGTATYNSQSGTYTKIGRLVHFGGLMSINSIGTGSTTVISGLPFTANSFRTASVTTYNTSTLATAVVSITGAVDTSASTITFRSRTAAATVDSLNALFANSTNFEFGGFYIV